MFFFISLYLQQVLHYSPLKTGLAYLPLGVTIVVAAGIASQLVTKVGVRPVLVAGMMFVAAGLLWFSFISTNGTYLGDVLFPSLLAAVGLGFSFVPVTIAAVIGVDDSDAGLASGLINTAQQVGGALGLAILVAISTARTNDIVAALHGPPGAGALTEGFQVAFRVGTGFAIAGALLAWVLVREAKAPSGNEAIPIAA